MVSKINQIQHWNYKNPILILFLLTLTTYVFPQNLLKTDGQLIVNEAGEEVLLKGMGLGGWMLQEGYMLQTADFANAQHKLKSRIEDLIGAEKTQMFYDAWLDNHVTEADVIALKNWGFNSIRLPMHYNLFTLPIEQEPVEGEHTWLDKGFELTDRLLEWCKDHELYLVLDLHAAPGGQGYDEGISDYNPDLPSLWESQLNRDKTIALWKRIAERYKDEDWIAGYDLINEPNWDLNSTQLRSLYVGITNAIREVDNRHILFIEGNWFANDFTGLTPPWDDNMVYSPHKYWSFNDQASIQWVLDMREQHNVPLYLGETGENSNVWFKDAITLFEEHNIGWAWWPMKKIESISGPLSIEKSAGYNQLLDFWRGNAQQPSEAEAFEILMDLTEKLQFDQCKFQPDVIDAMFRQQETTETIPFKTNVVPGVVYASDFDFGTNGFAYGDLEDANYHVSTNNFTAWNNGWIYRNDGVDIEVSEDNVNTNGFNVGWTDTGEWLKYTVSVSNAGLYDLHIRTASNNSDGRIYIEVDDAKATDEFAVPNSGDFQIWETLVIPGVVLAEGNQQIVFNIAEGGFNFGSIEFKYKGSSESTSFTIREAVTIDPLNVELQFNKNLELTSLLNLEDFTLEADGEAVELSAVSFSNDSKRKLIVSSSQILRGDQQLKVSYAGNSIAATDNSSLFTFERFFVRNTLNPVLNIPGIIQAEDFATAEGIQLETTTDIGQGQNIGYLDAGDYLEYEVNINQTAPYRIGYRVASQSAAGMIRMSLIDLDGNTTIIDEPSFPVTGGWQTWQTVEREAELIEGAYRLRIDILNAPFNLNWIEFESLLIEEPPVFGIRIFPNPVQDYVNIDAAFSIPHQLSYSILDANGRLVKNGSFGYTNSLNEQISIIDLPFGYYLLDVFLEDGTSEQIKLIKQ